jgi:hypothetical protein
MNFEKNINLIEKLDFDVKELVQFISATDQLRLESQLSTNQISNNAIPFSNGEKRLSNIECSEKRRQTRFVTKKGYSDSKYSYYLYS